MTKAIRLFAVLAILSLVAAACGNDEGGGTTGATGPTEATGTTATGATGGTAPLPGEGITVGLVYDLGGRGDLSFNDSAAAGLEQAVTEFGVTPQELEPNQGGTNRAELLSLLASQGASLIIGVGFLFAETVCDAGGQFPDVNFGDIDGFINKDTANCKGAHDLTADDNVASLLFAEEQGSFLVGAAAALKSTTGHVGLHRRRGHRPDPEVRGRLRRRGEADQPRHQDRRQVHHPAPGLQRVQRPGQGQGDRDEHVRGRRRRRLRTPPAGPASACSRPPRSTRTRPARTCGASAWTPTST